MSADLAVIVDDPSLIERSADPGEYMIAACERAKTWLSHALEHGDIDQIAELKSQADAIRIYTMSKQLGKDAQLSATEIVRRAERGIGVAIRRGQAEGTIKSRANSGPLHPPGVRGSVSPKSAGHLDDRPSPRDYLVPGETTMDTYAMTDGVDDDDFEEALAQAKAEENLSRANVVRKIRTRRADQAPGERIPEGGDRTGDAPLQRRKLIRRWAEEGHTSRQMAGFLGMTAHSVRKIARESGIEIRADAVIGNTHRHDSNRIVRETVSALEGLSMGLSLIDPDELDPAETANWAASLTESIRALNRLIKSMKEIAQ